MARCLLQLLIIIHERLPGTLMKSNKEIAEIINEPACEHNKKSKSGCSKPTPGGAAGGCAFDGA